MTASILPSAAAVFEALGLVSDTFYSAADIGEVAFAYVKHAGLEEGAPDKKTLVLDPTMCDALFKGLIKRGDTFPTHLPKVGNSQQCTCCNRVAQQVPSLRLLVLCCCVMGKH